MSTLCLSHISKHYKKKLALNDFTYQFTNGIYGLLGPNGAGKSTLMNIIASINSPDKSGVITWDGNSITNLGDKYRQVIGYMPQQQALYATFTGNRFLNYIAALKGLSLKEAEEQIPMLLELLELSDCAHKRIGSFSGGMKQRLLIAQALLGTPKLILLDEPTAGVDPKQRVIIKQIIKKYRDNAIVLISTHIISDIEDIADMIIMLKNGRIVSSGTISDLSSQISEKQGRTLESVYMHNFGDDNETN